MREGLRPALRRGRTRGLGEVAEHGHRMMAAAACEHPQLHRREILRLVDDDVPEPSRRAFHQRLGLVEQREVVRRPGVARGTGPQQRGLLVGLEHTVGGAGERAALRQQRAHETHGIDALPDTVDRLARGRISEDLRGEVAFVELDRHATRVPVVRRAGATLCGIVRAGCSPARAAGARRQRARGSPRWRT